MLTSQDIQFLVANHLKSEDFEVIKYEVEKCLIKIKILTKNTEREIKFVVRQFLNHANFEQKSPVGEDYIQPIYFINNIFVFEDFSQQGFTTEENLIWDLDHIKVTLKSLATYHAASINKATNESLESSLFTSLDSLMNLFPELPCSEFIERLQKINSSKINNFVTVCCGYVGDENILFRYEEGVPTTCKLLSFNLQHYNHPAYDVLMFIYTLTNATFRQHHLHDLLEYYYNNLSKQLGETNSESLADFETNIHRLLPLVKLHVYYIINKRYELFPTNEKFRKLMVEALEELKDAIIHPDLTKEDLFKIIKNKIGTTNYNLISFEILPIENATGFFGDHKKAKIKIRVDNKIQTLHLFVKFTPKGQAQKSIADDFGSFYKEDFFYRHFVPMTQKFTSIIDDCTVPCYLTRLDDVLVFEDFGIKDYGILNHRKSMSYEVVKVIAKQMAKLHASSIILEENLSHNNEYRLYDYYPKGLQETFFTQIPNHQGSQSTKISIEAIEDEIRLFPDPEAPFSDDIFRKKLKKAYPLMFELVKPSKTFRNVVCHGDLWINNILLQQVNGEVADCRLIDFQLVRYCPPAHDLLGFLHLATNRSFRKQYLEDVINVYYKEFSNELRKGGCDVEKIYSWNNFRKSIEYMLPQTICQTAIYYHICITDPELMKELAGTEEKMKQIFLVDRRDFIEKMCERDPIFREKNKEAVEDLRDLCIKYF